LIILQDVCGDNVCSNNENLSTCSKDCSRNFRISPSNLSASIPAGKIGYIYFVIQNIRNNTIFLNMTITNLSFLTYVNFSSDTNFQIQKQSALFLEKFNLAENLTATIRNLSNYTAILQLNFPTDTKEGIYLLGVQFSDGKEKTIIPIDLLVTTEEIFIQVYFSNFLDIANRAMFGKLYFSPAFQSPVSNIYLFLLTLITTSYYSTRRIKSSYRKVSVVVLLFLVLVLSFYAVSVKGFS
ncbi:MAG: hypothetical protein AABY22_22105, partial [Nanoarchaeota archaeon]